MATSRDSSAAKSSHASIFWLFAVFFSGGTMMQKSISRAGPYNHFSQLFQKKSPKTSGYLILEFLIISTHLFNRSLKSFSTTGDTYGIPKPPLFLLICPITVSTMSIVISNVSTIRKVLSVWLPLHNGSPVHVLQFPEDTVFHHP